MTDVVMPQMGESITEGTLTKWLKNAGDKVERDEPLFEISTDKVDTEIPSPAAGVLKEVLVQEGDTVEINTVVAKIDEGGDGAGEAAPAAESKEKAPEGPPEEEAKAEEEPEPEEEPKATPSIEPEESAGVPEPTPPERAAAAPSSAAAVKGPISPLVRRMAREQDIDLTQVKGSGAGGRITKHDVEAYLASRESAAAAPAAAPAPPAPAPAPSAEPGRLPPAGEAKKRVEPMSTMRQKIAEHMVFSKQTSAHVTTVHRVDMTAIAKMRNAFKGKFKERYGYSLTFLPFVARAASQALREFPVVNASIDGTNIIYHNEINIGIAVALDNGLIVPVIRNAEALSIVGLQHSIVDLAGRARSRQLKPEEIAGSTFSITNFGSFGSLFATPVINQPNAGILGVGAVTREPVVTPDDAIAIRSVCYLSLTFDHRLIDGAVADQFTAKVKEILENWNEQVL